MNKLLLNSIFFSILMAIGLNFLIISFALKMNFDIFLRTLSYFLIGISWPTLTIIGIIIYKNAHKSLNRKYLKFNAIILMLGGLGGISFFISIVGISKINPFL